MPDGSTEFVPSNNNLRQTASVKGERVSRLYTWTLWRWDFSKGDPEQNLENFAMQERVSVHPVYHPSGAYRVAVFRRSDGCYRYAVEEICVLSAADKPLWTADFDHSRSGIYDSPEAALHDAERDIVWLTGCPVTTLQSARGEKEERVDQVEVDLTAVMTSQDLHVALADALGFPEFYGRNWHAFWDAITGLVQMPRRLRLAGWTLLASRLPSDARQMRSCLHDMSRQYPEWASEVEYD